MAVIRMTVDSEGGYTRLPEGHYALEVTSVGVKEATEAGKFPQLVVKHRVVWSERPGYEGKPTTQWFSLSPKAAWRLRDLLDATDVPYEEDRPDGKTLVVSFDADFLVGRTYKARCYHEEYQGKVYERWADFEPFASSSGAVSAPAMVQQSLPMPPAPVQAPVQAPAQPPVQVQPPVVTGPVKVG